MPAPQEVAVKTFEKTIGTSKSFDEAVAAVEKKTAEKGFQVLYIHDIAATLTAKGFAREPLKIIEVCNANYASQALDKDVKLALMMPCPISVYVQGGKTQISTMLPTSIVEFFPKAGIEKTAAEMEKGVLAIIAEAK